MVGKDIDMRMSIPSIPMSINFKTYLRNDLEPLSDWVGSGESHPDL